MSFVTCKESVTVNTFIEENSNICFDTDRYFLDEMILISIILMLHEDARCYYGR